MKDLLVLSFAWSIGEQPTAVCDTDLTGSLRLVGPRTQDGRALWRGAERLLVDQAALVERKSQQVAMLVRAFRKGFGAGEIETDQVPGHSHLSVRQQNRDTGIVDDIAGHTAKHHFTDPRVSEPADR